MTWLVNWNGKEYDADPNEFTGRELSEIKRVTALTYRPLIQAILEMDPEAFRALFWTIDRREDPALSFTTYDGPPMSTILPTFLELAQGLGDILGKAAGDRMTPTTETSGTHSSSDSTDGSPEPSTTG